MAKNPKGWSHKLETLHVETLSTTLKKPRKQKKLNHFLKDQKVAKLHDKYFLIEKMGKFWH